ncbi:DNA repair protein RadC [Flavobacterium agricola]|uniref:DNA repair protein RadC n=1 Tax=Flavobacterium agricola TaxID=2870839 RepID=A0ABY6M2L6_9FLAO|nr:DNA repair protein RadC [Flavobacterium agricola]UYW01543.1 DNA repair protein RadC [Flavobacterium agricola]
MDKPNKISIKNWAEDDRPREKLLLKGRGTLSDAELIAILIGSGTKEETAVELAKRILQHFNNNLALVSKQSVKQLTQFKGIGEAKAISIVAALELGKRRRELDSEKIIKIKSAKDVVLFMQPYLSDLLHEEFWCLFLNNAHTILHQAMLSKGGITTSLVDIRILFKLALEHNATALILIHNHPSGVLTASQADKAITQKIVEAGKTLDISILDHVIYTDNGYLSFANEGLI